MPGASSFSPAASTHNHLITSSKSPEMEFFNGIKSSLLRLLSVWFSTLIFLFYKMLFINRLEFSYFEDLFKTRKEYGFR